MSFVEGELTCPECEAPIDPGSPFFSTALPIDGDLVDDAVQMHWGCLFLRADVEPFLDEIDAAHRRSWLANPFWEVLVDDAEVLVFVNPDPCMDRDRGLHVRVLRTGLSWDLSVSRFPECLRTIVDADVSVLPADRRARLDAAVLSLLTAAPRLFAELQRLGAPTK